FQRRYARQLPWGQRRADFRGHRRQRPHGAHASPAGGVAGDPGRATGPTPRRGTDSQLDTVPAGALTPGAARLAGSLSQLALPGSIAHGLPTYAPALPRPVLALTPPGPRPLNAGLHD